jgi:aminoglycoside phosphotransferase (APT) family kinase protein
VDKQSITPAVAARLVREQFPEWADLPVVPVALDGWDNTTFRLGDGLSVRLPSDEKYVAQVEKEHHWLPFLARHISLEVPEPVAVGEPNDEFPRPWSVYRWIDGETATEESIASLTAFASDLAGFLRELHAIDTQGGPPPGMHNFFRGGPLDIWNTLWADTQTKKSIALVCDDIDAREATRIWQAALESAWGKEPVWIHGDVTGSNLLVRDGELRAVIDFGCSAVGDPACDLVMAWTFFTDDTREAFICDLDLDDDTWARGRGWALWKAVITLAQEKLGGVDADFAARRWGWRVGPRHVVDLVIADARR